MLGRIYTAIFGNVTAAASTPQDFFELNPPATGACVLLGLDIGQSSEFGDAEEEIRRWQIIRGHTTSGALGSTPTATPASPGLTAFGGTVEANNTTLATAGSPETLYESTFNVRTGLIYAPVPEERLIIAPSSRLVVRLPVGFADAVTISGTMKFAWLT